MEVTIKPWGKEELLEKNQFYALKKLYMKANHRCSLQQHLKKTETIVIVEGVLKLTLQDPLQEHLLFVGDFFTIHPKRIHRMSALTQDVVYLETSTPELDDLVRIEDDYQRIGSDEI